MAVMSLGRAGSLNGWVVSWYLAGYAMRGRVESQFEWESVVMKQRPGLCYVFATRF